MKVTRLKQFTIEKLDGSLHPMGQDRAPGMHQSTIIREKKRAAGGNVDPIDGEQDSLRAQLGFIWERVLDLVWIGVPYWAALEAAWAEYLSLANVDIPGRSQNRSLQLRLERDGIKGTPDGFDHDAYRIESYKLTWRTMRKWTGDEWDKASKTWRIASDEEMVASIEENYWDWLDAEAGYMAMMNDSGLYPRPVTKVLFVPFWINGDYSYQKGHGPQATWTEVEFTLEEIEYRWATTLRYRDWMLTQGMEAK